MRNKQQDQSQIKWISDFIWNIADDLLPDVYVCGKYREMRRYASASSRGSRNSFL
jgi:type I restriction enzyme M protein